MPAHDALLAFLLARDDNIDFSQPNPPYSVSHGAKAEAHKKSHSGVPTGVIVVLVILLLLILAAVAWVAYTQMRARRLGLPSPTWRSYIPGMKNNARTAPASYEPARGGGGTTSGGFLSGLKSKLRNGGGGGGAGYTGTSMRSANTRGLVDPDQAWDHRMGDEDEELGYVGAQGQHSPPPPISERYEPVRTATSNAAPKGEYDTAYAPPAGNPSTRPQPPSRTATATPPYPTAEFGPPNPFDGDLSGSSRRQSDDSARRSAFRENVR